MYPKSHAVPLLFHLEHDPSELYDVAHRHPDILAELVAEAERLQREVTHEKTTARVDTPSTSVANSGRIAHAGREIGRNTSRRGQPIVTEKKRSTFGTQ